MHESRIYIYIYITIYTNPAGDSHEFPSFNFIYRLPKLNEILYPTGNIKYTFFSYQKEISLAIPLTLSLKCGICITVTLTVGVLVFINPFGTKFHFLY